MAEEHAMAPALSAAQEGDISVYTFGQNAYGELGHGDTIPRATPTLVEFCQGKNVTDVACGNENTIILCENGEVFVCGYNDSGQCGMGTTQRVHSFKLIMGLMDKQVVKLSAGNGCEHVAAVTDSGDVFTFGYNARGQLGHGTMAAFAFPTRIAAFGRKPVVKVACSYFHTLVVTEDNEMFGFGRNDFGQLGIPDGLDKHEPCRIPFFSGRRVLALACGQYHSIVSLASGGLFSFGKNDHGQLGVDAPGVKTTPIQVGGMLESEIVVQVACGYYHSVALSQSGKMYTFGRNDYGQLGLGHKQTMATPMLVTHLNAFTIVDVACGCYHTLALSDLGRVYPFGRNNHGQLGTNNTLDSTFPTFIEALRDVKVRKIAAGFYHTVCLTGVLARRVDSVVSNSLGRDFAKLINNPARSDVQFIVEGVPIYAHRCVLMARCEPLEIMLDGPMRERTDTDIVIPDQSYGVFLAMLEYIYTDRVAVLESGSLDVDFALDLISVADQYLLDNLKRKCEFAIQKSIDMSNFTIMIKTAHYRQAQSLKRGCIDFILANFGVVIGSPTFMDLPQDLMQEILVMASRRGVIIKTI
ncbi:Aste57867_11051 [Aphanomyces stellatus]|uniref:Aste57867_11051 protein n=1 Tax=Aphanomyces stellatus TaxID=120398 RepID=A0A485KRV8_9STRA|nr:hypothetical protein As57867_011009 [Aphanomyces stellatus]VFT87919.1 Aste57867_11051 [Aphanomyces stellatus]